ncbi:TniB family NTP-binding protein [Paenibacillus protaetiae]|uniref:AAA family ATPase n=1 Tax=Paenibacillus protaetiae TaxID=2509456 RepID=A0A4P6EV18_9BACL|nr:TniB family NTP-binding protein [Paenibacillus protaetiae]QAY66345.1 hypothetical protein ET464_07940 [Paenibacillus protaetiae]
MQENISSTDRAIYSSMDIEKRREIVRDIRIYHPRVQKGLDIIRTCHQSLSSATGLQCAIIEGQSGVGKSELISAYLRENSQIIYVGDSTKRTILHAEIFSPANITSFMEDLLGQLGDYNPSSGTRGNKNTRLVNLIRDCGVELIILDEFQHFKNQKNKSVNYEVADYFKSIINLTKVPVVLFGYEKEAYDVVKENNQLQSRFTIRYNLHPFGLENEERIHEFRTLLYQIDQQLPFVESSNLADPEFYNRLFDVTNGVLRALMKLIGQAAEIAMEKEHLKITFEDFKEALILHNCIGNGLNPFVA